jgi:hypothetical protein
VPFLPHLRIATWPIHFLKKPLLRPSPRLHMRHLVALTYLPQAARFSSLMRTNWRRSMWSKRIDLHYLVPYSTTKVQFLRLPRTRALLSVSSQSQMLINYINFGGVLCRPASTAWHSMQRPPFSASLLPRRQFMCSSLDNRATRLQRRHRRLPNHLVRSKIGDIARAATLHQFPTLVILPLVRTLQV